MSYRKFLTRFNQCPTLNLVVSFQKVRGEVEMTKAVPMIAKPDEDVLFNQPHDDFDSNPNDREVRGQTDEEVDEDIRNAALGPEDFEKFVEQFMFEHGAELDPADRESVPPSLREINEIALKRKAEL